MIFDVGQTEYQYGGTVSFTTLFTFPLPFQSFRVLANPHFSVVYKINQQMNEPVKLLRTSWQLESVRYVGMGIYHDHHACVAWSTSPAPAISMFYSIDNQTMAEFWWSPQHRGVSISYLVHKDREQFAGEYLSFANVMMPKKGDGEFDEFSTSSILRFNSTRFANKYRVYWDSSEAKREGVGIANDRYICVYWRGIVLLMIVYFLAKNRIRRNFGRKADDG